jgi:hypothetical protein
MRAQNSSAVMANFIASFAAIVFFAGTSATALAAAPAGKMSPEQIQSTFFNGQPFTASTNANVKFKMTFSADGKMKREPAGGSGGGRGEGTWKLSKEGFCSTWKGGAAKCFIVVAAGDNKWSVLKGSTILATWSK